jgi:hypothetical protein
VIVRQLIAALLSITICVISPAGCGSQVVPSTASHPPTDPSQVKIYPKQPKKYEVLGLVEVPVGGDVRWDNRGDANAGFEKLRAGAAARGANGLLMSDGAGNANMVLAGYRGTFYQVPIKLGTPNIAVAQAIYVLEE